MDARHGATIRVAVFGATGLAGSGVLAACLNDERVQGIVAITRRPLTTSHDKLHEVLHEDFSDLRPIERALAGIDALMFCLGVSATQVDGEDEYRRITQGFALAAARALSRVSPGATFHFVSGAGTNPKSRMMWARVKGETELALQGMKLGGVVCWRPGMIVGDRAPRGMPRLARAFYPVARLLRFVPSLSIENDALGRAMLQATFEGLRAGVLENRDIRAIERRYAPTRADTPPDPRPEAARPSAEK